MSDVVDERISRRNSKGIEQNESCREEYQEVIVIGLDHVLDVNEAYTMSGWVITR
ncbi:hypothetical protein DEO72_LG4g1313 [Vigna unguiculata]|uniref:Uncharacterized protein n=1 Tax=Vigna unguiculata TaxID=3917 RepID=A0A4D6LPJ6_VIGUN|nr:hypothetical protein DEO72_LG4g1313 [Vigna unguiculata]